MSNQEQSNRTKHFEHAEVTFLSSLSLRQPLLQHVLQQAVTRIRPSTGDLHLITNPPCSHWKKHKGRNHCPAEQSRNHPLLPTHHGYGPRRDNVGRNQAKEHGFSMADEPHQPAAQSSPINSCGVIVPVSMLTAMLPILLPHLTSPWVRISCNSHPQTCLLSCDFKTLTATSSTASHNWRGGFSEQETKMQHVLF